MMRNMFKIAGKSLEISYKGISFSNTFIEILYLRMFEFSFVIILNDRAEQRLVATSLSHTCVVIISLDVRNTL